ncbi:DinB family protein [Deinococcus antarcticus]|uniref:DinB family protein n=1 Tax=Deinococcus antarcticus TaxID=1298767 RepID=A0ABV8A8T5_9DEIO
MTDSQHYLDGLLDILQEALEGGKPGEGTAFVENTRPDGAAHGLRPTLARVGAAQASRDIRGASIPGHAQHAAFHLEVAVRWDRDGDRGPFDWQGSFQPEQVNEQEWQAAQARLKRAYEEFVSFARTLKDQPANGDIASSVAGVTAHAAYHLGAIRQMVKEV